MWSIEKIEVRKVTKQLVNEFVSMERLPNDRELREKRLLFLKEQLEQGRFRTCEWASVHCKETNKTYRVNGKHTSTMFGQMETVPNAQVIVERYACETMQDAADLYATFDSRESARSTNDINQAFAASVPELRGVRTRAINNCVVGMYFAMTEARCSGENAVARAERLLTEYQFVLWAAPYMAETGGKDKNRAHLSRGPVCGAMFLTFKAAPGDAQEFWHRVQQETDEAGSPTRVLARYLIMSSLHAARGSAKKRSEPREMYVKCLHAWNAWCNNQATELKYYAEKEVPKVEKGRKPKVQKKSA